MNKKWRKRIKIYEKNVDLKNGKNSLNIAKHWMRNWQKWVKDADYLSKSRYGEKNQKNWIKITIMLKNKTMATF